MGWPGGLVRITTQYDFFQNLVLLVVSCQQQCSSTYYVILVWLQWLEIYTMLSVDKYYLCTRSKQVTYRTAFLNTLLRSTFFSDLFFDGPLVSVNTTKYYNATGQQIKYLLTCILVYFLFRGHYITLLRSIQGGYGQQYYYLAATGLVLIGRGGVVILAEKTSENFN